MRPIAALLGTDIAITTKCGCMRVVQFSAEQLVEQFGAAVTIEYAERRLRCRGCGQRPALVCQWSWSHTYGLSRGVPLPVVPEWTGLSLDSAREQAGCSGQ